MMQIEDLNELGFIFHSYEMPDNLNSLESKAKFLESYISKIISIPGEKLYWDIDTISKGMEIKPHFHTIPGSFQVVCWFPEDDTFIGRDFIYGNPLGMRRFRPKKGMMCFMKPNDVNFIHGVTPLESNHIIYTLGFSSMVMPFDSERSYDIFIDEYSIQD